MRSPLAALPLVTLLAACSSSSFATAPGSTDAGSDGAATDSVAPDGPSFIVHVRATTKPFTQTDGLAGQTATKTA
ncbi:MAG: hypothetical protein ACXVEF_15875, partial [Polyangiales bacterium]